MLAARWCLCWIILCWQQAWAAPVDAGPAFERRSWTQVEGAPTSTNRIAQSADGLLWFASSNGLYRFDGEKFRRVDKVYGHPLRSQSVAEVSAVDGGLAVGYLFGGFSVFSAQSVQNHGPENGLPSGTTRTIRTGPDGKLYAGTQRGLAVLDGQRWTPVHDQLPPGTVNAFVVDQEQTLWVMVDWAVYARPRNGRDFVHVFDATYGAVPNLVLGKLAAEIDGQSVLMRFGQPPAPLRIARRKARSHGLWEGPDATVWAWIGDDTGLVRLRQDARGDWVPAQSFEAGGTLGRLVTRTFVDRENNFWVATANGVERYRAQRIHEAALPDDWFYLLAQPGLDDAIFVAGDGEKNVLRLTAGGHAEQAKLAGVTAIWREHADSVWTGSAFGLSHLTHAGIATWPLPGGTPPGREVQSLAVDGAGHVWVSIMRQGLYRFAAGQWLHIDTGVVGEDATPVVVHAAGAGRVWLGFTNNRLGEVVDGKVRLLATQAAANVGNVLSLLEVDGHLLVGGELGMAWAGGGQMRPLMPERMAALRGVSGMGRDKAGDLWAHGADGIFHIAGRELARFWAQPGHALKWEVFNFEDGIHGHAAEIRPLPTLAIAPDGRVVYATASQVGWIDPATIRRNPRPPTVLIDALRAGGAEYAPADAIRLAPGTTTADISFAATALSLPERVQIRYQLDGVDRGWQAPQGERAARYTNLAPGKYIFRVIAANEDGVWNMQGATLHFEILPALWQTDWFRLAALLTALACLAMLYRWRIAVLTARSAEKMAARLEERQRIARNLHDNLLQGVQALVLRCHTILMRLPKGSPDARALDEVLQQADHLIVETRDEVMGLRDPQAAADILAVLQQVTEAIDPTLKGRLEITFNGDIERLRSAVARELFQVLQEAMTNAARHSRASRIAVTLTASAHGVDGAVIDDGVGMPAGVADQGRAGHWGIVGMRERIASLGGKLSIDDNDGNGTAVRFTVAAAAAYAAETS